MCRNQTIAYYEKNAECYCASTREADMSDCRNKFLSYLEDHAGILDAGCGSGRDAKKFLALGYSVTAMDASARMCKEAEKLLQKPVLNMTFQDMSEVFITQDIRKERKTERWINILGRKI